jgi:hypothetical protein
VMDAQIALLRKRGELEAALRALAGPTLQGLPTVVSVTTAGNRRLVRLQLASGHISQFEEGETIRAGMVLGVVEPRRVIVLVEDGKRYSQIALDFALGTPVQSAVRANTGGADVPRALLPQPPEVPLPVGYPLPSANSAPAPAARPSTGAPPARPGPAESAQAAVPAQTLTPIAAAAARK